MNLLTRLKCVSEATAIKHCRTLIAFASLSLAASLSLPGASVLTGDYDNARTASNTQERILNPNNVNVSSFGKLASYSVDGQVVGQPLYAAHVKMPDGVTRMNILYVGTMHNTLYAFDADHPGSAPIWQVSLGASVPAYYAGQCPAQWSIGSELGILSTPVIDKKTETIYAVAANPVDGQQQYTHSLYAFNLATGEPKHGGSVVISASVSGSGSDSANGTVAMNSVHMMQRPALLLSNGTVYAGFSGCGPDPSPYHGWVLGYNADNIQQQTVVYNSTPDGDEGGIWQSGRGLVADKQGAIYFETANGDTDNVTNFANSFVKLNADGSVADWFTPSNFGDLSNLDMDLSTTSPLLTPDSNLLIGGGKEGMIYVLNANALGQSNPPVQTFWGTAPCSNVCFNGCQKLHSLAYLSGWRTSTLYTWGTDDVLRAFTYRDGQFDPTPSSQGSEQAGYPGGLLSVSSFHGRPGTGIVWAIAQGELHAYDASNVGNELWNTYQNWWRDGLGGTFRLEHFMVANGRVYIPDTQNHIVVYGLLDTSSSSNTAD